MDLTLIEVMPVGDFGADREEQHLALDAYEKELARQFTLSPSTHRTDGPARYVEVAETGGRGGGFITPLSHRFCEACNSNRKAAGHDFVIGRGSCFAAVGRGMNVTGG